MLSFNGDAVEARALTGQSGDERPKVAVAWVEADMNCAEQEIPQLGGSKQR